MLRNRFLPSHPGYGADGRRGERICRGLEIWFGMRLRIASVAAVIALLSIHGSAQATATRSGASRHDALRARAAMAGKKGVGDDDPGAPQAIDAVGARWYYNWTPKPSKGAIRAQFVPMIWGAQSVDADLRAAVQSGAHDLLTFNEPDSNTESNVSVAQAIALWPKLEATGLRLGSPATTTGSPWIDQFMAEARKRHLRVDFLCLHWYGDITAPDPVGALRQYLETYWERYHLPIWLTEYSGADFSFHRRKTTVEDNARFAAESAAMMDKLPFVERYAWFGTAWTPDSKDYPTSGLYNNATHSLSPVGVAYAAAAAK